MLCRVGYGVRGEFFGTGSGSGPADLSLKAVLPSTVADLDATMVGSYAGTGTTWSNLVAVPADGSAQTAYNFSRGDGTTATTYPTFTGTAGHAAAYFAMDGGDYFRLASGTNTTFLQNLTKTTGGADFWLGFALRGADWSGVQRLFNSGVDSAPAGWCSVYANGGTIFLAQRGTAAASVSSGVTLAINTDYLILISHSHASNRTRFWINTTTAAEVTHNFSTNTSAMPLMGAYAETDGGFALKNGARVYGLYIGNEDLNNTKAAALITALETRHGRNYTP
jgi:hypothetical protein